MDLATVLVLSAVLLMVLAYVLQPFITRGDDEPGRAQRGSPDMLRSRAALLAERNRIYTAIRELDFEHQTNKVSDDDYADQRHALVAQGVEVLKQIDALPALDETPAHDPVEAALVALKSGGTAPAAQARAKKVKGRTRGKSKTRAVFCPKCGKPAQPGDRFCASCGARL